LFIEIKYLGESSKQLLNEKIERNRMIIIFMILDAFSFYKNITFHHFNKNKKIGYYEYTT